MFFKDGLVKLLYFDEYNLKEMWSNRNLLHLLIIYFTLRSFSYILCTENSQFNYHSIFSKTLELERESTPFTPKLNKKIILIA